MVSIYDKYNCSFPESHQPDLEYSDISGTGVCNGLISTSQMSADQNQVVAAFITVGYVVTLLSLLDYFLCFGLVPPPGEHQEPSELRNRVDRAAITPFRRALQSVCPSLLEEPRVKEIHAVLHAFIVTSSEAQTYTGISILISGTIVLFSASLSEYHWEMIVLLAWSCHVTNVTAMTSFRSHFLDRPRKRYWMLCLMGCLAVMLVMAILPTGFWYSMEVAIDRYAICAITPERIREVGHALSHPNSPDSPDGIDTPEVNRFLSMILPLCMICITFCTRAVKLSVRLSQILSITGAACEAAFINVLRRFDDMVSRVKYPAIKHYLVYGVEPLMIALLLSAQLHWEFVASLLSELFFALASIGWVTRRAEHIRHNEWTFRPQNQWTFGQILPLAVLIYPLVSLTESLLPLYMRTYISAQSASQPHTDPPTTSTNASETNGPSTGTDFSNLTPIQIYVDHPSSLGQTWPWKSYLIYQYIFQVFLLAANIFIFMGDGSVFLLSLNFEPLFFLHPFTTYITILLHLQAEFILNFWYAADGSNRQQEAAILHVSVSASIQVLFFGLNSWLGYQIDLFAWRRHGWHFHNLMPPSYHYPSLYGSSLNALTWISCYLILYHVVALGISLWANSHTTGGLDAGGAGGAEVTPEERG